VHPEEQVVTGEAVAVELRLAGVGSRGVAAGIDIVIVTMIQVLLLIIVIVVGPGGNIDAFVTVLIVTQVGVLLGYPVGMETLWGGRTVGKAIMGLQVVRDDGGPIRFRHAFVRGAVGVFLEKPGISSGLFALGWMLGTSRHKRLGDLAAGTVVLQQRVPSRIDAPIAMPPALAGWAASLDLSAVDDGLALRLRQFLGRASQLTPAALATIEHQLTTDVTSRVGPPPPGTPGWAIITAVLAERRRRAFATQPTAAQPQPWGAPRQPQPPPPATPQQPPAYPTWATPPLTTPTAPAASSAPETPKPATAPTTPEPETPASTTGFVVPS
jgi:uncharacterized RDD family membrane protein YckC